MLTLRSQNLDHIRCGTCLGRDVLSDAAAQVVEGEIISGGGHPVDCPAWFGLGLGLGLGLVLTLTLTLALNPNLYPSPP